MPSCPLHGYGSTAVSQPTRFLRADGSPAAKQFPSTRGQFISSPGVLKTQQGDTPSAKEDRAQLDLGALETYQVHPVEAPCWL